MSIDYVIGVVYVYVCVCVCFVYVFLCLISWCCRQINKIETFDSFEIRYPSQFSFLFIELSCLLLFFSFVCQGIFVPEQMLTQPLYAPQVRVCVYLYVYVCIYMCMCVSICGMWCGICICICMYSVCLFLYFVCVYVYMWYVYIPPRLSSVMLCY